MLVLLQKVSLNDIGEKMEWEKMEKKTISIHLTSQRSINYFSSPLNTIISELIFMAEGEIMGTLLM